MTDPENEYIPVRCSHLSDSVRKQMELMELEIPAYKRDVFPKVLAAGDAAGSLTAQGAALLDETGQLQAGIPLCPPEGDAGAKSGREDQPSLLPLVLMGKFPSLSPPVEV